VDFSGPGRYDLVLYVDDTDLRIPPDVGALHMPLMVAMPAPPPTVDFGQWVTVVLVVGALSWTLGLLLSRLLKPRPVNENDVLERGRGG
jgi:hypothetical protein